ELGRPRLLLDRKGMEEFIARAKASPSAPEIKDLLREAYAVAAKTPHPYIVPEEEMKKGVSPQIALSEQWMRSVGDELVLLTVAAKVDNSPVLTKAVHDGVVALCRYPTWGRGVTEAETNMDLACAHAACGVALAWDWFPELWSDADRDLIVSTVSARVGTLLSGVYGKVFWARMYADNHNHVGACGLGWCGIAFYSDIPAAPEWLAAARLDFQHVAAAYPADGSSAEGVPYWSYGVTFILGYIEGARLVTDAAELYQAPFLRNMANYRLNVSLPGLGGTLPWADAPARDYAGPQHILRRLSGEYHDAAAGWLAGSIPFPPQGGADVRAFMALWQPDGSSAPSLPLDYHHAVADLVETRSGWGPGDYLLAVKSGFNNRNHSHLDAGALAFAFGGDWLLTTPGYGKGADQADYWDPNLKRWYYFATSTESHSALLLNGKNQRFDAKARGTVDAFLSAPLWSWTGIDLTAVYDKVSSVRREILHRRGEYALVLDSASAPEPLTAEWLAQVPADSGVEKEGLVARADARRLVLGSLFPDQTFAPRKPTAPRVDIPAEKIHTYALKDAGTDVDFAVLLQPYFEGSEAKPLRRQIVARKPHSLHAVIQSDQWTDHVLTGDYAADPQELSRALGGAKLGASARVVAFRIKDGAVDSAVLVGARSLENEVLKMTSDTPANVALQRVPDGSWIVDADVDLASKLEPAQGFSVVPKTKGESGFRWVVAKGGDTKAASDWLASLVVFRERSPIAVRPLPPQPPLPSDVTIPIEAEAFSWQKKKEAEVVAGRPGASGGKSVRGFGSASSDNALGWAFDVPKAGRYRLILRYAARTDIGGLAVLIDGAAPAPELAKVPLPATGGWSMDADNWKDLEIQDGQGNAFAFNLSAGKHELRLANPGGAIALDRMEFRGE
ncbi:MAG TPA: heparinase II/III family protein, partial [Candidatus Methylacidiphilales bacterium]